MADLPAAAIKAFEKKLDDRVNLSFERDIQPMFRDNPDIQHMKARGLDLSDYNQVSQYRAIGGALDIFRRVESGNMPKDGPRWTMHMVYTFGLWIKLGLKP